MRRDGAFARPLTAGRDHAVDREVPGAGIRPDTGRVAGGVGAGRRRVVHQCCTAGRAGRRQVQRAGILECVPQVVVGAAGADAMEVLDRVVRPRPAVVGVDEPARAADRMRPGPLIPRIQVRERPAQELGALCLVVIAERVHPPVPLREMHDLAAKPLAVDDRKLAEIPGQQFVSRRACVVPRGGVGVDREAVEVARREQIAHLPEVIVALGVADAGDHVPGRHRPQQHDLLAQCARHRFDRRPDLLVHIHVISRRERVSTPFAIEIHLVADLPDVTHAGQRLRRRLHVHEILRQVPGIRDRLAPIPLDPHDQRVPARDHRREPVIALPPGAPPHVAVGLDRLQRPDPLTPGHALDDAVGVPVPVDAVHPRRIRRARSPREPDEQEHNGRRPPDGRA